MRIMYHSYLSVCLWSPQRQLEILSFILSHWSDLAEWLRLPIWFRQSACHVMAKCPSPTLRAHQGVPRHHQHVQSHFHIATGTIPSWSPWPSTMQSTAVSQLTRPWPFDCHVSCQHVVDNPQWCWSWRPWRFGCHTTHQCSTTVRDHIWE